MAQQLANLIVGLFRGRADKIAVAKEDGAFAPHNYAPDARVLAERHLCGKACLGFYLMNPQSNVYCSCIDFDNKEGNPNSKWREDAEHLYTALVSFGLTPLFEVSQSGSGAHVWLFFSEPTPAWLARSWWRGVERRTNLKFKEIYPRQDKLKDGGLGNLVRFPLWNQSHFADPSDEFKAIEPETALAAVHKVTGGDLRLLAHQLGMGELAPEPTALVVSGSAPDGSLMPLRVQRLLDRKNSLLARRWSGDTTGMTDPSNSAIAMSIAVELVRQYVPTPEVAAALRYWCKERGSAKGERDDWVDMTVTKAYDFIIQRNEKKSVDATTFEKACLAYLDQLEKGVPMFIPTGISSLDESMDGAGPGEVVIIAARPGHGKSALGFQWLDNASAFGTKGLIISEEMSAIQIGKRRLLSVSVMPQTMWSADEIPVLREEVTNYHKGREPVYIVEGCNTIDRVEEVIDQFVTLYGVGIAAVDYLQLLGGRGTDRYEVVTDISRRIAQCAKRHNIPILVLCQLNRGVEGRPDNVPKLSDLRESGQIEQDADVVIFTQWVKKFDPNMPPDAYRIYVGKRRNGPIRRDVIDTTFDAERQHIGADNRV